MLSFFNPFCKKKKNTPKDIEASNDPRIEEIQNIIAKLDKHWWEGMRWVLRTLGILTAGAGIYPIALFFALNHLLETMFPDPHSEFYKNQYVGGSLLTFYLGSGTAVSAYAFKLAFSRTESEIEDIGKYWNLIEKQIPSLLGRLGVDVSSLDLQESSLREALQDQLEKLQSGLETNNSSKRFQAS